MIAAGDIVVCGGWRYRIRWIQHTTQGPFAAFERVRKNGEPDRRFRGFSGPLHARYVKEPQP